MASSSSSSRGGGGVAEIYKDENPFRLDYDLALRLETHDVEIVCSNESPPIHALKLILAARSPVFTAMFTPPPPGRLSWKETMPGLTRVDLRTETMSTPEAVETFVRYLYSGKLKLTPHIVLPIIYLSEKYDVPFVLQSAKAFLTENLYPSQAVNLAGIAMSCFGGRVADAFGDGNKKMLQKERPKEEENLLLLGDWMLGMCVLLIEHDPIAALHPALIKPSDPPDVELAEYLLSRAKIGKAPEILLFRWAVAVRSALLSWFGGAAAAAAAANGEDKKPHRADSLLSLIRFELMSAEELKTEVTSSGLVSKEVVEKALAMLEDSSQQSARMKRRRGGLCSVSLGEMKGHASGVKALATFAADDGILKIVSASADNTAKLWNAESGQCEQTFEGHTSEVNSVATIRFSSLSSSYDGKVRILTGSWDGTVRLWDNKTGSCEAVLESERFAGVESVAAVLGPEDGIAYGISGSDDGSLTVWNLDSRACVRTIFSAGSGAIYAVATVTDSADGSLYVISGGLSCSVKIWSFASCAFERTLEGHSYALYSLASFVDSDHKTFIVSGSSDATVKIWSFETGNCVRTLEGHEICVTCLVVFPGADDGKPRIASGGGQETVIIWSAENGVRERTFRGEHCAILGIAAFAEESNVLVSGGYDCSVRTWSP